MKTWAHCPSCFNKNGDQNAGQKLEVLDATEPMKVMIDEAAHANLSYTPDKVPEFMKNNFDTKIECCAGLANRQIKERTSNAS